MGARRRNHRAFRLRDWRVQCGEHEPGSSSQVPATRCPHGRSGSRLARLLDGSAIVRRSESVPSGHRCVGDATTKTLLRSASFGRAVRARRQFRGLHRDAVRRGLWSEYPDRRRCSVQTQDPRNHCRTLRRRRASLLGRRHRLRGQQSRLPRVDHGTQKKFLGRRRAHRAGGWADRHPDHRRLEHDNRPHVVAALRSHAELVRRGRAAYGPYALKQRLGVAAESRGLAARPTQLHQRPFRSVTNRVAAADRGQSSRGLTARSSRATPRSRRSSMLTSRQSSICAKATYCASYVFAHPSSSATRQAA